jgi:bifunctional DNA-binding transcriptional regulator/antitoxin component of YhaV-PrlF toxin-antitoxin module
MTMRYVHVLEKNRIELPKSTLSSMGVRKGDRLLVISKGTMVILMPEPKKFAKPVYRKKKAIYPKYSYTLRKRRRKKG